MTAVPSARALADSYVHTSPFWEAAERGQLVLQYCRDANRFQHPPRPVSIYTGYTNLEWRVVSGSGSIYAVTELSGVQSQSSATIVNVKLDVGVHILGKLVDGAFDQGLIGRKVRVTSVPLADGTPYPAFTLE